MLHQVEHLVDSLIARLAYVGLEIRVKEDLKPADGG
jgi:hypothetical protein